MAWKMPLSAPPLELKTWTLQQIALVVVAVVAVVVVVASVAVSVCAGGVCVCGVGTVSPHPSLVHVGSFPVDPSVHPSRCLSAGVVCSCCCCCCHWTRPSWWC